MDQDTPYTILPSAVRGCTLRDLFYSQSLPCPASVLFPHVSSPTGKVLADHKALHTPLQAAEVGGKLRPNLPYA